MSSEELRELCNLLSLQHSLNFKLPNDKVYDVSGSPAQNLILGPKDDSSQFWVELLNSKNGFWFGSTCIATLVNSHWFNTNTALQILLDTCSTFSRGLCSHNEVTYNWVDKQAQEGYLYGIHVMFDYCPQVNAECVIGVNFDPRVNKKYKYGIRNELYIYSDTLLSTFLNRRQLKNLSIELIGVQDRPQRRQIIKHQLEQMRVEYNYFPAVNGKAVNIGIFDKSAHKALKNPSNAIQVQYKDKLYFHNVKSRHLRMSYGEFGCALSHINIVLKHSPNPCLFLEDDARIDDLQEFLIQLRNLPSFNLFDICYFQNESIWYPPQSNMFLNEHFALNIKRGINCTHGYLLSGRGMQMFKNYITHTSQMEFSGQMHGLFVNVPSDDILSGLCRDGIMISISPGRRLLSTNKATSDIWNIYKYNEKHTSVVWDKPPVPNYKIYLSENLP